MSVVNPTFDRLDHATWGDVLNIAEVASIYRRSIESMYKLLASKTPPRDLRRVPPAPDLTRPYQWRRATILRHLQSAEIPAHPVRRGAVLRSGSRGLDRRGIEMADPEAGEIRHDPCRIVENELLVELQAIGCPRGR